MATGILLAIVVSVTSAITAGQQHSYEAHQSIAGCLAAEDLMGRILTQNYDHLPAWNGYTEAAGAMTDMNGQPMPGSFSMVGRDVQVGSSMKTIELAGSGNPTVKVQGRDVLVRAFNTQGRSLAVVSRFIVEPQP